MTVQGQQYTSTCQIEDGNGDAFDPDSITVSILDPDGTTIVNGAIPTKLTTGSYRYSYIFGLLDTTGNWTFRWSITEDGVTSSIDEVVNLGAADPTGIHYASTPAIMTNLIGLSNSLSTPVMDKALYAADNYINRQLATISFSGTPAELQQIAEDYSTYQCLIRLQHSSDGLSEAAKEFKQNAVDGMTAFINENQSDAENPRYASSMTPANTYTDYDTQLDYDDEEEDMKDVLDGEDW